jgi:hypothetical protein
MPKLQDTHPNSLYRGGNPGEVIKSFAIHTPE